MECEVHICFALRISFLQCRLFLWAVWLLNGYESFCFGKLEQMDVPLPLFCVQGKIDAKRFSELFDMNVASFIFRFENKFDR